MKKTLLCLMTLFSIGLTSNFSFAQQNIITNGNFETQYPNTPPSYGSYNIKGADSGRTDQLPSWMATTSVGSFPSVNTSYYVATNATSVDASASSSNPSIGGTNFSPYSGRGCVSIGREPSTYRYDGMITQQVSLIKGHVYRASFYALRRPTGQYKSLLSFSVINSTSVPSYNASNTSSSLSPSPYAKVNSDYISSDQNWTLVSGTFVANSGTNDSWIVVGYASAPSVYDASLNTYSGGTHNSYTIDDVSLVDMGSCTAAAPITGRWECTTDCASASNLPKYGTITGQGTVGTGYGPIAEISLPAGEYNIYLKTLPYNPWQGPPTSSVYWYYISGFGGNSAVHFTLNPGQSATFNVTQRTADTGACTPSQVQLNFHADPTPVPYSPYRVSPNPVSDQLTITTDEQAIPTSTQKLSTKTSQATLFDIYGKQVKTQPIMGGKAAVNVQDLPDGLYNLRVENAGKPVIQHIQVKH